MTSFSSPGYTTDIVSLALPKLQDAYSVDIEIVDFNTDDEKQSLRNKKPEKRLVQVKRCKTC